MFCSIRIYGRSPESPFHKPVLEKPKFQWTLSNIGDAKIRRNRPRYVTDIERNYLRQTEYVQKVIEMGTYNYLSSLFSSWAREWMNRSDGFGVCPAGFWSCLVLIILWCTWIFHFVMWVFTLQHYVLEECCMLFF